MNSTLNATEEHPNLDLFYIYTESVLKSISESVDDLNSKLTTMIGFSGVMLHFAGSLENTPAFFGLPDGLLKITICLFFSATIAACAMGLLPKPTAGVVPPGILLDEW